MSLPVAFTVLAGSSKACSVRMPTSARGSLVKMDLMAAEFIEGLTVGVSHASDMARKVQLTHVVARPETPEPTTATFMSAGLLMTVQRGSTGEGRGAVSE